jgi:hypothetical protein
MIDFLTDFVVSVAPTFLVSRLLLWITSRWSDSLVRLIAVHVVSLVLCVAGASLVVIGSVKPMNAFALFATGELAWLLVDLFRLVLRRRHVGE